MFSVRYSLGDVQWAVGNTGLELAGEMRVGDGILRKVQIRSDKAERKAGKNCTVEHTSMQLAPGGKRVVLRDRRAVKG